MLRLTRLMLRWRRVLPSWPKVWLLISLVGLGLGLGLWRPGLSQAVPPPTDWPEEILRTEIIIAARSPIDGSPMTAAAYAELQAELQAGDGTPPTLTSSTRQIVFLLQMRRAIRTFFPFLLN